MKKTFIFRVCSECGEPVDIICPAYELGYNAFGETNFHGELSVKKTEKLRQKLIRLLKEEGKLDKAEYIEKNTKVFTIEFLNYETNQIEIVK